MRSNPSYDNVCVKCKKPGVVFSSAREPDFHLETIIFVVGIFSAVFFGIFRFVNRAEDTKLFVTRYLFVS